MMITRLIMNLKIPARRIHRRDDSISLPERLIEKEAALGGDLFGSSDNDCRRQFFCLDEHTWIWHETRTDKATGAQRFTILRYDISSAGQVYKKQNNGIDWQPLGFKETENFKQAVEAYRYSVLRRLYPEEEWLAGRSDQPY